MKLQRSTCDDGVHENVGGISETTVEISPGVTVLVGRNATNRTSFLQAVVTALVEYLTDYTGYLTVALLPEDVAAPSKVYDRIPEISRNQHPNASTQTRYRRTTRCGVPPITPSTTWSANSVFTTTKIYK